MKKIIYVDFDGVIHQSTTPFRQSQPTHIPDPPVPGAIEWLSAAVERFHVVIFTCRMLQPESEAAIHNWLFKHGMANHLVDQLAFSCVKRGSELYIDDRAWRFAGTFPSLDELDSAVPWNRPEGEKTFSIALNEYQIANLTALLEAIGYPYRPGDSVEHPLRMLDTGDWIGEIFNKLPIVNHIPNKTRDELRNAAAQWRR